ncbi:hypothetical protein BRARA_J00478 [Brassica rapa]|uniref:RNase H type-1 domain-containing protein n=1 Tax=Brassica campestris TaxID=3711 RepID=A0A397XII5_BRACM|nr:hypothetical protein BRARA_J00478 [Brassica rapa]
MFCMIDRRITSVRFETDCSDLVKMTTNSMDWPTFATEIETFQRLHEDFEDVSMSYILWSWNDRTDSLTNDTRTKCYFFLYRLNPDRWRRINSSVLHLV